jgi:hypothetical protein
LFTMLSSCFVKHTENQKGNVDDRMLKTLNHKQSVKMHP